MKRAQTPPEHDAWLVPGRGAFKVFFPIVAKGFAAGIISERTAQAAIDNAIRPLIRQRVRRYGGRGKGVVDDLFQELLVALAVRRAYLYFEPRRVSLRNFLGPFVERLALATLVRRQLRSRDRVPVEDASVHCLCSASEGGCCETRSDLQTLRTHVGFLQACEVEALVSEFGPLFGQPVPDELPSHADPEQVKRAVALLGQLLTCT